MKKLIIKKLSDHSVITQTQVADHDEFQWVIENKHSFGQDDVYEDYEHLISVASIETVKEAYDEIIPEHVITKEAYDEIIPEYVDEDGVTIPEQVISHPAEDVVVPEQVISHPAELIEHPAVYETRQRIAIPKDWYVETIDLAPEMEAQIKVDEAKAEISKGINALAVFKVLVKEKGLTTSQIAELFSSPEINKIISALTTGSLPLASALVANYQADGVLVSEFDKEAVINALR